MKTLPIRTTLPVQTEVPQQNAVQSWEGLAQRCEYRVSRLAQICQVSTRTLQRHFRKNYDLTLSEWLREVRLEKSRVMLKSAPCVKTVAYELGYKQPSHFTRDFKQRYGVPPKMWQVVAGHSRTMLPTILAEENDNRSKTTGVLDLFANC